MDHLFPQIHSGYESWRTYHGPRLETNARLMDQMDSMDELVEEWNGRKE